MKKLVFLIFLVVVSCLRVKEGAKSEERKISTPEIPALISDPEQRLDYMIGHFWDSFFSGKGPTDTAHIIGVQTGEVEQTLSNYLSLLDRLPVSEAQKKIEALFAQIEKYQVADTSSHIYPLMTQMVSKYLYDPNSPMRNEDFYLPFVKAMTRSPFTREDSRTAYEFELRACSVNQYGSKAPDFVYKDIKERSHHLYDVKAEYTMLFFSNPGCEACREIIDEIATRSYIDGMISSGRLAIVNIYIDSELDKWRAYQPNYPSNWHTGYDPNGVIREDELYFVRAIPCLYLLGGEKEILMKDPPIEKVLSLFDNLNSNQYVNNQS